MSDVVRIGVSLEDRLLARFDTLLADRGIGNRSEAIRDLVRDHLVEADLSSEVEAIGTVTIVYDHHKRALSSGLTSLQHEHSHHVISSMHVHVDHRHCMEVIVLKGKLGHMRRLADQLIGAKGVLHGKLVATSMTALTGEEGQHPLLNGDEEEHPAPK